MKKDVKRGVQRRVFEDNLLSVEIGLSLEMVLASDSEFQEYFAELIRRGANTLLEFAESKGVQISKEEFWTVIDNSLKKYLALDFSQISSTLGEMDFKRVVGN